MKDKDLSGSGNESVSEPEWSIGEIRDSIDMIDSEIVSLLNRRLSLGMKLGDIKKRKGLTVLDGDRERQVRDRLAQLNHGPLQEKDLEHIFSCIISATRKIQDVR